MPDPVAVWTSPAFVEEARAWSSDVLAAHGLAPTGEWDQPHARVWSSAISLETDGGRVWFKVNGPGTAHEGALVAALDRLVPGLAPASLAVDADRGWSLTRDGGPVLRAVGDPDATWGHWEALLPRYAEAQLALAPHRDELLATGVSELTSSTLPGHLRRLVDELAALPVAVGGLSEEETAALTALLPSYDEWCAELDASPVPDSVQHDDLHSANVCWPGSAADARVIDWGDASVGLPLATMLCTLSSIAFHAGLPDGPEQRDDPRMVRVRDAYLEPFTSLASHADLVRWVELGRRTGCVTRALCYQRALGEADDAAVREMDFPVRGWLAELLG